MSTSDDNLPKASVVATQLAKILEERGKEYALGGAFALGFWGQPRGTLDVDVTLFLPTDQPTGCVQFLQEIGCECSTAETVASLREHGFCQVHFHGTRIDVFLPLVPFYAVAKQRIRQVSFQGQSVRIWDAETLCVFKMMFFRRKDLADVEQVLRTQGENFDRSWVHDQIVEIFGEFDPRVSQWGELCDEVA